MTGVPFPIMLRGLSRCREASVWTKTPETNVCVSPELQSERTRAAEPGRRGTTLTANASHGAELCREEEEETGREAPGATGGVDFCSGTGS